MTFFFFLKTILVSFQIIEEKVKKNFLLKFSILSFPLSLYISIDAYFQSWLSLTFFTVSVFLTLSLDLIYQGKKRCHCLRILSDFCYQIYALACKLTHLFPVSSYYCSRKVPTLSMAKCAVSPLCLCSLSPSSGPCCVASPLSLLYLQAPCL